MANEQYCLRWSNHQPNFISVFTTLLSSESLVDVTIAAEGRFIQAHKVVLSACSSYFQLLLSANPCQHPIIILKDIEFKDLKVLVEFMYCGEVNVAHDQLTNVLKAAESLHIKGLTEIANQSLSCEKTSMKSDSSASIKRKRFRKSSTGSGSNSVITETSDGASLSQMSLIRTSHSDTMDSASSKSNNEINSFSQSSTDSHISQSSSVNKEAVSRVLSVQHQKSDGWTLMEQISHSVSMVNPNSSATTLCSSDQLFPLSTNHIHSAAPGGQPKVVRRRNYVNRSDENFERALTDVREGRVGFCKAAKMYGINNRTLWLEFKKRGYQSRTMSIEEKAKQPPTPTSSSANNENSYHLPPTSIANNMIQPPPNQPFNDQYNSPPMAQPSTPTAAHYATQFNTSAFYPPPSTIHNLQSIPPN